MQDVVKFGNVCGSLGLCLALKSCFLKTYLKATFFAKICNLITRQPL